MSSNSQKVFFSPPSKKKKSLFKKRIENDSKSETSGADPSTPGESTVKYSKRSEEKQMSTDTLFSNLSHRPETPMTKSTMLSDIPYIERDFPKKIKNQTKVRIDGGTVSLYTPMMDIVNNKKLPEKTDIKCFWCRHSFTTPPLGLPLNWVPSTYEIKGEGSSFWRKKLTIKERKDIEKNKNRDPRNELIVNEYYEVEGIYCSMNCIRSEVEQTPGRKYKDSYMLLKDMYRRINGVIPGPNDIIPAPNWRLLKEYGGDMSIEHYRGTFTKCKYMDTHNIIRPVTRMYEKINLNK